MNAIPLARVLLLLGLLAAGPAFTGTPYVPPPGEWAQRDPQTLGFDPQRLAAAVANAQAKAVTEPQDMYRVLLASYVPREPDYRVLGPLRDRQGSAGLIIRHGYIAAQWGDVERADMTFSVAKSYLATLAGVAVGEGRIADPDAPVARSIPGPLFAGAHNGAITWRHLLQQNSDWQGRLWDTPDWADRPEGPPEHWPERTPYPPGSRFKYNDVRVNLLALALLEVLREPLPDVLRTRIMQPIGASSVWSWRGYRNSTVTLDGKPVESVSGGGHFGGGPFISALDHARFGLLILRNGRWGERQLLAPGWIAQMHTPSPSNPEYGLLWWLNTGRRAIPGAPASAWWATGYGGHYIYLDPEHDLLVVLRWVPDLAGAIAPIQAALLDP